MDENLPHALVPILEKLGHEVDTDNRFLITQDLDFSDIRKYRPGTHEGVLIVRLAELGRSALTTRVATLFSTEAVDRWQGCLVVATDYKVRVRQPPKDETAS